MLKKVIRELPAKGLFVTASTGIGAARVFVYVCVRAYAEHTRARVFLHPVWTQVSVQRPLPSEAPRCIPLRESDSETRMLMRTVRFDPDPTT